jgi:iron complex outermembrane receptor protein
MTKAALVASAAFAVAPGLALAQTMPAPAAPGAAPAAGTVEELVVTARRREETLKDVPVAVTAVTGEQLDRQGARDITSLQQFTPNLTLQVARGSNSTLISFIRGVGQQDPLWGFEPGVGLYIDDVYIARPQAAVLDIYDVSRVEVLRGPQGTLYGRNTIGGAIKYVTGRIGDEPELKIRGQYGSYNEADLVASAKAKVTDMVGVGITWAHFGHDGYGKNLTTGADQYDKDVNAARATLEFTPSSSLFFRLAGDIVEDNSNPRHGHRETVALDAAGHPIPGGSPPPGVYDTYAGAGDDNHVEAKGVSFTGEWDVSDSLKLKSISAYRSGRTSTVIDFDELAAPILDIPGRYSDHQFTEELQALYTGKRLQGVVGLFYLNANAAGAFDTDLGEANVSIATSGYVDTESWAAYADFSYDVTDALKISLGGRYTRDDKTGHVFRAQYLGLPSPLFGGNTAILLPSGGIAAPYRSNFTNSRSFERFTPRASVSYQFDPDLTGYVSYSEGFKSGGFDMRADTALTPDSVNGYAPETVQSYEGGLKGYFFDRRLSLNTAVFYAKYKNQQVTLQTPVGASVASQVLNVGRSHMYGVELEGTAKLTEPLTANFSLGYIKAQFDEYKALDLTVAPPVIRDFAGSRVFQNTPEWTGSAGLTYDIDLDGHGSIEVSPQVSYRDKTYMFEVPSALDQPSYWLVDAHVVWTSPGDRYRVGLHGTNLTDKKYRVGGYNFPQSAGVLFGNSVSAFYGPPRVIYVSAEARF